MMNIPQLSDHAIPEDPEHELLQTDLKKTSPLDDELLLSPPPLDHYTHDDNVPLPFPRLQYLNLAHNKVNHGKLIHLDYTMHINFFYITFLYSRFMMRRDYWLLQFGLY